MSPSQDPHTSSLYAISPVDGRYHHATEALVPYFSEYALLQARVHVEIAYLLALIELPLPALSDFPKAGLKTLRRLSHSFSLEDAQRIKAIEKKTAHDIKAVEYFLKERFEQAGLEVCIPWIHFALTSQDINHTAYPWLLQKVYTDVLYPRCMAFFKALHTQAEAWRAMPMLSRTHGQAASPTTLGKEIHVFHTRLTEQFEALKTLPFRAKFGGATGGFNAHVVSYPDIDWLAFARAFVEGLGLQHSYPTTQIEAYDHLAAHLDAWRRIGTILIDLARDLWHYISLGYFSLKTSADTIGSSTMPHKINPIHFENAEGNLGIAQALFEHLAHKLPISRLQRDLSDSTTLRNLGLPFAHLLIAVTGLEKGLASLEVEEKQLHTDLEQHWEVVTEALQTILRREGYPEPYEALKTLARQHKSLSKAHIHAFIQALKVPESLKKELQAVSPFNYTGLSREKPFLPEKR